MSSTYERYRDTLREAHVAALAGRHADALAAYRDAAAQIEGRAAPHVGIGRMELAMLRPVAALAAFETALVAEPANHEALTGLARAVAALRPIPLPAATPAWSAPGVRVPDDGPEIREIARRWEVALTAGDAGGLLDVATAFGRAERPGAAASAVRDAIAIDPTDPRAYQITSWLERRRGRPESASLLSHLLERYLSIIDDPDELEQAMAGAESRSDVAALLDVADRHRRRGRPRSALDAAFAALLFSPVNVDVHLAIARVHLGMGFRTRAVRDLAQLARYLEVDGDTAGRSRLAAFVNDDLRRATAAPEPV
jgi:tetratricopeptide (TPR) repeat protein